MADIYDQEYVDRKLAEVIHCKTCGQLMTPELQQWSWQHLLNGDRRWTRRGALCKPCLSEKSLRRQTKDSQKYKKIKQRMRERKRIFQEVHPEKFRNDRLQRKAKRVHHKIAMTTLQTV